MKNDSNSSYVSGADDLALVARAQQGELQAFDELVRKHQHGIYTVIYNMTANHHDAAELTQETFLKAYRSLSSFKGQSAFFTWLCRIAINNTLNRIKYMARRPEMHLNELAPETAEAPELQWLAHASTPAREAALNELRQKLNEALQRLSDIHRAVVILHDIQGLQHEEIAKILGCSVGTARSRLFYARQQLRAYLAEYLK